MSFFLIKQSWWFIEKYYYELLNEAQSWDVIFSEKIIIIMSFFEERKKLFYYCQIPKSLCCQLWPHKIKVKSKKPKFSHTQNKCSHSLTVNVIECVCNVIFAYINQSCKTTRVAKTLWVEEEPEDKVTVFELKLCLERAPLFCLCLCLCLCLSAAALEKAVFWRELFVGSAATIVVALKPTERGRETHSCCKSSICIFFCLH
jgi:hypothetical protein